MGSNVSQISRKPRVSKDEALEVLVTRFYKRGKLSLHQGASLLGMTTDEFIRLLGEFEIPINENNPLDAGF